MHDTAAIDALRERVAGLSGPDREVDCDLCIALGYIGSVDRPLNLRRSADEADRDWLDYEAEENGRIVECIDSAPVLTASIDAALALVERMLPGVWWLVGKGRTRPAEPLYGVHLMREGSLDDVVGEGEAETPSLAIILALLSALKETDHA